MAPQSTNLREIIREQQADMDALSINLDRAQWTIQYLEQRNKQLEDQQVIMELQNIRENRQAARRRRVEFTSLEQELNADMESWLKRANIHLERKLEKGNKEKNLLRHMVVHYMARDKVCKARIKSLKAKLKKAPKRKKEHDRLQILAKASLAQHSS